MADNNMTTLRSYSNGAIFSYFTDKYLNTKLKKADTGAIDFASDDADSNVKIAPQTRINGRLDKRDEREFGSETIDKFSYQDFVNNRSLLEIYSDKGRSKIVPATVISKNSKITMENYKNATDVINFLGKPFDDVKNEMIDGSEKNRVFLRNGNRLDLGYEYSKGGNQTNLGFFTPASSWYNPIGLLIPAMTDYKAAYLFSRPEFDYKLDLSTKTEMFPGIGDFKITSQLDSSFTKYGQKNTTPVTTFDYTNGTITDKYNIGVYNTTKYKLSMEYTFNLDSKWVGDDLTLSYNADLYNFTNENMQNKHTSPWIEDALNGKGLKSSSLYDVGIKSTWHFPKGSISFSPFTNLYGRQRTELSYNLDTQLGEKAGHNNSKFGISLFAMPSDSWFNWMDDKYVGKKSYSYGTKVSAELYDKSVRPYAEYMYDPATKEQNMNAGITFGF